MTEDLSRSLVEDSFPREGIVRLVLRVSRIQTEWCSVVVYRVGRIGVVGVDRPIGADVVELVDDLVLAQRLFTSSSKRVSRACLLFRSRGPQPRVGSEAPSVAWYGLVGA